MRLALLAFTFASVLCARDSFAQNCTATSGVLTGENSGVALSPFDTCTATDQLAVSCSGLNPIGPATDAIWQVDLGPGAISRNIVLSTSVSTYDLYVGLMSGTCSGACPCPLEADSNGPGGSEFLGPLEALSGGTYFLLVTTFGGGCGPVVVSLPNLPVALNSFTVE